MAVSMQAVRSNLTVSVYNTAVGLLDSDVCIVGGDATSLAAGCLLSAKGRAVRLLLMPEKAKESLSFFGRREMPALPSEFEVRKRCTTVSGARARTNFTLVSSNPEKALQNVGAVFVSYHATEYGAISKSLSPFLGNGQTVCLTDAPLGAGLQLSRELRRNNRDVQLNILEMGSLLDCAKVERDVLLILGQRARVNVCGNTRNETRRGMPFATALAKGIVPSSNLIERGLSEVEKILRPALLLFAIISGRRQDLSNIANVLNPAFLSVVEGLDADVQAIAHVYKSVVPNFAQALYDFGMASAEHETVPKCLEGALKTMGVSLLGPSLIDQSQREPLSLEPCLRVLKRDVAETLALLSDLARVARISVPVINSVMELASSVAGCDLQKSGRKAEDLGLIGLDVNEIVELINS